MTNSIVLARDSFQSQSSSLVRSASDGPALCLLAIDRSGSMSAHADTPRLAANELIETLRKAPGAENTLFALMTFGDIVTLDVAPVRADMAPLLTSYVAAGNTALYQAVHDALSIGLEFRGFVKQQLGLDARVAFSIISDGADTASGGMAGDARHLSEIGRRYGFALQAVGLGIDAKRLAQDLGFEPGLAHNAPASQAGVRGATMHTSRSFIGTMMGFTPPRDTPTPPSGT